MAVPQIRRSRSIWGDCFGENETDACERGARRRHDVRASRHRSRDTGALALLDGRDGPADGAAGDGFVAVGLHQPRFPVSA